MASGHRTSSRRKEREKALQTLYMLDIAGGSGRAGGVGGKSDIRATPFNTGESASSYGSIISEGVTRNLKDIDRLIERASENWSLARMAVVDRNILRIAVYELLYHSDVPNKVVMDEAVELANSFGAENSASFINGVIDKVYKEILLRRRPSVHETGQ
jgi:N utilization substance protein B